MENAVTYVDARLLRSSLATLLKAGGMDDEKAEVVADVLVEADMIGHHTHGASLAPDYLNALASGEMTGQGDIGVLADRGACMTWDGHRLPGAWLVRRALDEACARVADHGVVTLAIRNSHHTGALAAYMKRVTDQGYVAYINCSTVSAARMAPFGGTEALFTPNPQAYGFPTNADPILIDVSASITTTSMTKQLAVTGERFPEAWALTAEGEPTDDPEEVMSRGGTLMPIGGPLKGYKGFGLALAVDVLSQGLSGSGRSTKHGASTLSVFVQVLDPGAFSGLPSFVTESSHIGQACRNNRPRAGVEKVRVPGDAAAASRRRAEKLGIPVHDALLSELERRAGALGVKWLQ